MSTKMVSALGVAVLIVGFLLGMAWIHNSMVYTVYKTVDTQEVVLILDPDGKEVHVSLEDLSYETIWVARDYDKR